MNSAEYNTETVEKLAVKIKARRNYQEGEGGGVAILLGAGASLSAGIPLAKSIVEEIFDKHPKIVKGCPPEYPEVMKELGPYLRNEILRPHIEEAKINPAHLYLSRLVKAGYVDRILTTNFDSLAVQGLALENIRPFVYDVPNLREFKPRIVAHPAVIYLHGQFGSFNILHSPEETGEFKSRVRDVLNDTLGIRTLIVVGYGGLNDPVFEVLAEYGTFTNGLYWVSHTDKDPPDHVYKDLLEKRSKYAYYVKGQTADNFFMNLVRELGLEEPEIIFKPFTLMKEAINAILKVEDDPNKSLSLERTKRWIKDAITCRENEDLCQKGKNNIYLVWRTWAQKLIKMAGQECRDKAKCLLEEAIYDLQRMLKHQHNSTVGIIYLGRALWRLSRITGRKKGLEHLKKAVALLSQAAEKYEKSKKTPTYYPRDDGGDEIPWEEYAEPNISLVFREWGNALCGLALFSSPDRVDSFTHGIRQLTKCTQIAPDKVETFIDKAAAIVECSCQYSTDVELGLALKGAIEPFKTIESPMRLLKPQIREPLHSFSLTYDKRVVPPKGILQVVSAAIEIGYHERALDLLELAKSKGMNEVLEQAKEEQRFSLLHKTRRWQEFAGS